MRLTTHDVFILPMQATLSLVDRWGSMMGSPGRDTSPAIVGQPPHTPQISMPTPGSTGQRHNVSCRFVRLHRLLPNLWTRYFENEWTDYLWGHEVKAQGHTRPKGTWQRHHSRTCRSNSLSETWFEDQWRMIGSICRLFTDLPRSTIQRIRGFSTTMRYTNRHYLSIYLSIYLSSGSWLKADIGRALWEREGERETVY